MNSKEDNSILLSKIKDAFIKVIQQHEDAYIEQHKYDYVGMVQRQSRTLKILGQVKENVQSLVFIESSFNNVKELIENNSFTDSFKNEIYESFKEIGFLCPWREDNSNFNKL